ECEFIEEGVSSELPDFIKTCAYRVVQEGLHNCEKHAAASLVKVSARQTAEGLIVEIEDDGRGFELKAKEPLGRHAGLGVMGMRERAANAGGALEVDSSLGCGARLTLRLPAPRPAGSLQAAAVAS